MKNGNWLPISKVFIKDLPHDRKYTRLEAAYSLQFDYDCKNRVTVAGYSALWSWSRSRVSKFLDDMGVEIIYPETTKKRRNQKGHIAIHKKSINETYNKHIRCIENIYLQDQKNIKKTYTEHKKDISPCSTKEPINLNPKNTISVPLKDGTFFIPGEDYLNLLKNTYKNIDIEQEFKNMTAWCFSNPDKQKTKRGSKKFVNGWMNRANGKATLKPQKQLYATFED